MSVALPGGPPTASSPPVPPSVASKPPRSQRDGASASSVAAFQPLLNTHLTSAGTKVKIAADPIICAIVFACALFPPLGIWAYEKYLLPSVVDAKKTDAASPADEATSSSSPTAASSSSSGSSSRASSKPRASSDQAALFQWTWWSLFDAVRSALSFSLPDFFTGPHRSWSEVGAATIRVLQLEKKLCSPRFYPAAAPLGWVLTALLAFFILVEDAKLTLKDTLSYTLRFYVLTAATFAVVCSVHSQGLLSQYKLRQREREAVLDTIRMKFVTIESVSQPPSEEQAKRKANTEGTQGEQTIISPHLSSQSPDFQRAPTWIAAPAAAVSSPKSPQSPSLPADDAGEIERTTALQVLKSIDSLSKVSKARTLERRLVWITLLCVVRGFLAVYSGYFSGSRLVTSLLYGVFHFLVGVIFFGLGAILTHELHEDDLRWSLFSSIHSRERSRAKAIPFYVPLATIGRSSRNIVGWYAIRGFLRDFKGRFDFCRLEVMVGMMGLQLVSVCGFGVYWAYFHLGLSAGQVYDAVIGENLLVAFDTFLCLTLLLDMVTAALAINRSIGSHAKLLLDEELQRSFSLTDDQHVEGGKEAIQASLRQMATIREKLTATREEEKLSVLGVKLDERIVTYIRGAIASYAIVFSQSMFKRKKHATP